MRLTSILIAASFLCCVLPAHADEPYTYMAPQLLWTGAQQALGCKTCEGDEMQGMDPARLFQTADPLPVPKVQSKPDPKRSAHVTPPSQAKSTAQAKRSLCAQTTAHAQTLMNERRDEEAEQYLKGVLAEHPQDKCIRKIFVQLSMWRAWNFMKCGNIECGARRLREALLVDPANTKARYMLDRCYQASGIDPGDSRALSAYAQKLLKEDRNVAAFVEYEHLLASDPSAGNYAGYARSAQRLGQNDLAVFAYSEALKLDPLNSECWRELGLLCQRTGNDKIAQEALWQSLELKPDDDLTSNALIGLIQKQIQNNPDEPMNHVRLGHVHALAGDIAESADEYSKAELIRNGDEKFKQLIQSDKLAAEQERRRAPEIQQAIETAARQAAVEEFERNGPSPLRRDVRPQDDVAFNHSGR